ncbi:unnamed protein product [Adineta ricciae]|uniref:Uncharacterized protein n=1 Tax=Adineta ricciae TaxID=249248 RepID=A0A815CTY1_ADIRI|nr:unnamed protein product [Adineta ricciae]CAF1284665.1 unnamed protein product [Adineta ricciae]
MFLESSKAMKTGLSKYSSCLTWTLIGILVAGVALASVTTLYIREKYTSTETTASPVIMQTSVAQVNSSPTDTHPYLCGNAASCTLWTLSSCNGITMTISTTICSFKSTALHFSSMTGITNHWMTTGYTAIYYASQNGFTVYARSS